MRASLRGGGLVGTDLGGQVGVELLEHCDLTELAVEAGLHLRGVPRLLVAGHGQLGQAVAGGGLLLFGPLRGVLGQLALHLEVFLGRAELVEQVGVADVLDLEQGTLLGRFAGVVGVEGGEGVVGGRVHEGFHREVADVLAEQLDLLRLGVDRGGGLAEGALSLD